MITQRFFAARSRVATVVLAGLIGAGVVLAVALRRQPGRASPPSLAALVAEAEAGDESAMHELGASLDAARAEAARPVVAAMFRSDRPEIRAAAAAWVGRHGDPQTAPLIVARLSDQDWRVRAAAFDALRHVAGGAPGAPASAAPLRDTPVDRREELIFAWLTAWRGAGEALPPLPDLCELYAAAGGRWLAGAKLAESCLQCHAPPAPHAAGDFVACATCHRDAHDEWSASAHARSVTHLNLLRVDQRTKQVAPFDHGPREGLVCTSCHAPVGGDERDARPPPNGAEALFIPHRFRPASASGCVQCHAETQAEWLTWTSSPRPIASRWLPGEVTWDQSPAAQNCVSCHMPSRGGSAGALHGFRARRDAAFMRDALIARLEPPTAGRGARLVLTNLAGHRYPSGTIRRALRIELRYDVDDDSRPPRLLARLTDASVPTALPTQSALRPAEQRGIDLPAVNGAFRVTCTIIYERNQFEPGAYELPLLTLTGRVDPTPTPTPTPTSTPTSSAPAP